MVILFISNAHDLILLMAKFYAELRNSNISCLGNSSNVPATEDRIEF